VSAYSDHNNVSKGEVFQFIVEISGASLSDINQPLLPNIPFQNMGVSTGQSSSISVINGKVSKSQKSTFSFSLRAIDSGRFIIPPVNVKIGDKNYKTNTVEINVTKNSKKNNSSNSDNSSFATSENISDNDIFIVSDLSKTTVYKNEPIFLNYIIYTKYNLKFDRLGEEPNYNGFWKEDLTENNIVTLQETKYKGQKYYKAVLRTLMLSPNRSGILTVPSFSLYVDAYVGSSGFWGFTNAKSLKLTSKPIQIKAIDLPDTPANSDFSGAVGSFKIDSMLNPKSLKAGETALLTLTIKGSGNLKQSANPTLPPVSKLKVLDPEVENSVDNSNGNYVSIRTIRYPVLPQEEGFYQIPSLKFTYFDPEKRDFITLSTEDYKIQVEKGNIVLTGNNLEKSSKEGSDIGFIKTNISLKPYKITFQNFYFWFFIALIFLSIPAHYLYKLEQDKLSSNIEYLRNRTASKILKKYLKEANIAFHHHHADLFYDNAQKGVLLFLADKMGISRGSTQAEIIEALSNQISDQNLFNEIVHFIEKCSKYKYMPVSDNEKSIRSDFHQLKLIVNRLTKVLH
jgi:hypothetical protein